MMVALSRGIGKFTGGVSDAYDRAARLYPGLIALSPIVVMIPCVFGQQNVLLSSLTTLAASCGCAYALTRVVRNAGHRLQPLLFSAWGGAPTTQLLRHANEHFDVHTKDRFHKTIAKGLGKKMPTAASEKADPQAADEMYRAAAVWLIHQTRDARKFPLVLKENAAFGFHRNAFGIRKAGIAVALGCLVFCIAFAAIENDGALQKAPASLWISAVYSASLLAAWMLVFTEEAVKRAGFSYAERLCQCLDSIGAPKTRPTTSKGS